MTNEKCTMNNGNCGASIWALIDHYCVGALNGWQTIWKEMISDHGNQFIRKLRKDTPSICYALQQASAAADYIVQR